MDRKDNKKKESDEGRVFYRNASEASVGVMETLRDALLGIVPRIKEAAALDEDAEAFIEAAERLGAVQFVYWQDVPEKVMDAAQYSGSASEIDDSIRQACLFDDWESFSSAAYSLNSEWDLPGGYRRMLNQCVDAFCQDLYGVACTGLCAVFDGLLSDFSDVFGEGLGERLGAIVDRMAEDADGQGYYDSDQIDSITFLVSLSGALGSFGEGTSFTLKEPRTLNRLRITHGRMGRKKTMLDCLKLLRMIQGLLILEDMCEDDVGEEDDA